MQWLKAPYTFEQDGTTRFNSECPDQNSVDLNIPITIGVPKHPQMGGFYTFSTSLTGTCIEKEKETYSVRDGDGTIHTMYKKTITDIKQ